MRLVKTKKLAGGLALAGALALSATFGFAQQQGATAAQEQGGKEHGHDGRRGGRGGMEGFGFFGHNLNLSDAQKTQLEAITARHREATKNLHEQGRALHQNKSGAFDGTFNEAAVRQAAQARANLHVEMEVARARMMSEMYAVLTPEQKAQLAAERQQWEQKRQERRARRGAMGGGQQQ